MKAVFLVVIVVLLGYVFGLAGCLPVMPTPDNQIHVFVFAGFRRVEVEYNIGDAISTDDSPLFGTVVLRYEITNRWDIIDLAEMNYIGTIDWQVPDVAYAYQILVDASPTDAILDALFEWAEETTEDSRGTVTVLADSDVLRMIQRLSPPPPVVMSLKELRSREP